MSTRKLLASATGLPLALAYLMGTSNPASAALLQFQNNDQFNFVVNGQLNAFTLGISNPPLSGNDARPGIDSAAGDDTIDLIFAETLFPTGSPANSGTVISATNRIVNNVDPECPAILAVTTTVGCTVDADPGERSVLRAGLGNTGVFANIANTTVGSIRSFDDSPANGGTYLPDTFNYSFVNITDSQGRVFNFTLDSYTASVAAAPGAPGFVQATLNGVGRVSQFDPVSGQTSFANYIWSVTGQFFNNSGTAGDPFVDGITAITTISSSFIVTSVPEPTGVIGTVVALGLGLLTTRKKKS